MHLIDVNDQKKCHPVRFSIEVILLCYFYTKIRVHAQYIPYVLECNVIDEHACFVL